MMANCLKMIIQKKKAKIDLMGAILNLSGFYLKNECNFINVERQSK